MACVMDGCGDMRENTQQSDSGLVRELLWLLFPDRREQILSLEEDEREDIYSSDSDPVEVGVYTLASEVFVQGVLTPLLAEWPYLDEKLAIRCSCFLELLLGSQRPSIREMVSIRITDHLLGYPENWMKFRKYAGDFLLREVQERRPYYKKSLRDGP